MPFDAIAPIVDRSVDVNGAPGIVNERDGRPVSVAHFTVVDGKVIALDILADPDRLAGLGFLA